MDDAGTVRVHLSHNDWDGRDDAIGLPAQHIWSAVDELYGPTRYHSDNDLPRAGEVFTLDRNIAMNTDQEH